MTGAEDSPRREGLDSLFDNLPTAASRLPERTPREEPAPGTRRALRAARDNAEPAQTASEPVQTASEPAKTASQPAASEHPASPPTAPTPSAASAASVSAASPTGSDPAPVDPPTEEWPLTPSREDGNQLDDLFAPENHRGLPPKKRGRGCLIGLIIVIIVLGGVAAGGAWVYNTYQDKIDDLMGWGEPKDYEAGQATGEALVTIKKGDTGSPVSTALFNAGVTKTESVFYDYLVTEGSTATFYPGVYRLQKKMTAAAALKALEDPANRMENTVRISEGGTVASSLPRIVDGVGIPLADLQAAVKDPTVYGVQAKTLEGWLFPAVYTFDPDATAKDVIARMVARTQESLAQIGVPADDAQRVLAIASIVQREGHTADFAKVSRVIENRLDPTNDETHGLLQMDSTAQYGYGLTHEGPVSSWRWETVKNDQNPWNTYQHAGLPASPISNPSHAAIEAAYNPVDGPWFYFVTVNLDTGKTVFSATYAEQQAAEAEYRQWCKDNPDGGCY